jgi:hypothetical protein
MSLFYYGFFWFLGQEFGFSITGGIIPCGVLNGDCPKVRFSIEATGE